MRVGFLSDARCDLCDELIRNTNAGGFELHEFGEGDWRVVCIQCVLDLELNEGK